MAYYLFPYLPSFLSSIFSLLYKIYPNEWIIWLKTIENWLFLFLVFNTTNITYRIKALRVSDTQLANKKYLLGKWR